jgi:N-acetylmuramoyl-L-alanine amidase
MISGTRAHGRQALLVIAALLLVPSGTAAFQLRSQSIGGAVYVNLNDIATYYGMRLEMDDDTVALEANDRSHRLVLTVNRRRYTVDGIKGTLFASLKSAGGVPLLSERDFRLVLDPILRPWGLPRHPIRTIVIDPGHGGKDHGARGRRYNEKTLNLMISVQLKELLEQKGYRVYLTRSTDTYPSLSARTEMAHRWQGDLFISIHSNATRSASVSGIETFIVTPKGAPSSDRNSPYKSSVAGNEFDRLNARLGYEFQRHMILATGAVDRGIKHKRFQVLREARAPAVLLETGFVSNPSEEMRLGQPAYQRRLVTAMAAAIISFDNALP